MYACRTVALCCLLSVALRAGQNEPSGSLDHKLVVYLRANQSQSAQSAAEMKREVTAAMETTGYSVSWRAAGQSQTESIDAAVVVVDLRGECRASMEPSQGALASKILASTAVADGELLPFSWVECSALSKYLSRELTREASSRRDSLYGRAMGRLIAHELFHILANTKKHDDSGIAKAAFSSRDLLNESFHFGSATQAKLKTVAPAPTPLFQGSEDAIADDTAIGR